MKRSCLFIILITLSGLVAARTPVNDGLLRQAQEHHKNYRFNQAIEIYRSILAGRPDSTLTTEADSIYNQDIQKHLIASENGKNMLMYASTPYPVTKQIFPTENFFLNYPGFEENSWVNPPAEFMKEQPQGNPNPFNIMNVSSQSTAMVFSAMDESGAWNIMYSKKLNDTLWSAPQMVNENITTSGNEILPHLSPDGKTLYFSSNGHYGMGGYDLYMSTWNEETGDWDVAQNLGFPYSSTGNDYLCYNTPDGLFTIFSSDRETSPEEVTVYITKYEVLPLKKEILQEDAPEYATLSIEPVYESAIAGSSGKSEEDPFEEDEDYARYADAVDKVRELQQELKAAIEELDKNREEYSNSTDSLKKVALEETMRNQEANILTISEKTTSAVSQLQQMELDFLSEGIIIAQKMEQEAANTNAVAMAAPMPKFEFAKNSIGTTPVINFEVIEPEVDLSFKIADESTITDLSELPNSLVYHIQLMTTLKKASVKSLKGLTPVFERRVGSGKYTYSAGVFHTYAEALKNLNTVRKRGFPTAMITAYNNGKSVSTKNARIMEKQDNSIYRVTIAGYETLPAEALAAIRANTNKDIAKVAINGVMKFVIGPFTNRLQAETLANALSGKQITAVEVEKVEND